MRLDLIVDLFSGEYLSPGWAGERIDLNGDLFFGEYLSPGWAE